MVPPRFNQFDGLDHDYRCCDLRNASSDLNAHRWMHDLLQATQHRGVTEHNVPQTRPIDLAVGANHAGAKGRHDLIVDLTPTLHNQVSGLVGVNHRRPQFCQHGGDGAFAGSNVAGQADEVPLRRVLTS